MNAALAIKLAELAWQYGPQAIQIIEGVAGLVADPRVKELASSGKDMITKIISDVTGHKASGLAHDDAIKTVAYATFLTDDQRQLMAY
jgi:hypothetical protein